MCLILGQEKELWNNIWETSECQWSEPWKTGRWMDVSDMSGAKDSKKSLPWAACFMQRKQSSLGRMQKGQDEI